MAHNGTREHMLELRNVHSYYGAIHALKGISLTVDRGEIVTLIGSNGAGKTTTIRTISGILHPREGQVILEGRDISHTPAYEIVKLGVAQSPEGRRIFPRLTVLENLEMGAYTRNDPQGIAEDLERVFELFPRLKERRNQQGGTLSGGEQQMLAIGRALMARPKLLLLDEPSMGLAPVLVETIFETIVEINKQGTTILLVEQNALMALEVAHRGYVLQTGQIVLEGPAQELAASEMVRKAYLGEE
ncbi:branched-chain amino acid transport system ATP-binding protein [Ardenticatena maritima]|uniref:Branched-chain amino acid transport system ATP-binding protein n=2 Tax=Ardenticatena maritima TaxID=872965 RepID=A0A0M8KA53_9CHLR|nr:ABC transporter ATP-binding protein [Ardenticatena maritima]GAP63579.1 branched-chain amino acid transport system ATP-binding protein [Ardenticatena maritima]